MTEILLRPLFRGESVIPERYDAGVSFQTMHHPPMRATCTVIANSSEGAWPVARFLYGQLAS